MQWFGISEPFNVLIGCSSFTSWISFSLFYGYIKALAVIFPLFLNSKRTNRLTEILPANEIFFTFQPAVRDLCHQISADVRKGLQWCDFFFFLYPPRNDEAIDNLVGKLCVRQIGISRQFPREPLSCLPTCCGTSVAALLRTPQAFLHHIEPLLTWSSFRACILKFRGCLSQWDGAVDNVPDGLCHKE